jgi:phosphatidyl-myo-inositol dimannoside synthase
MVYMEKCSMAENVSSVRFITRKWAPAMGGMETYCVRLTEQLAKSCQLDIIALPGQQNGSPPSALSLLKFGVTTSARLVAAPEAQVVHIGDVACWPFALAVRLRHPRSKIVISAHGSDLTFADKSGWRAAMYRYYLALAVRLIGSVHVIANSNWIADKATSRGFKNVHLVLLATDIDAPQPTESPDKAIFYAGRIAAGKGLRFFIEQVLPELNAPTRFRVAGNIWDQHEAAALDHPSVDYLGMLSPDALAAEYEAALCTVVPSQSTEGFGLVAVEAAACGGVVIASDHSGLRDAAGDGVGILVEAANAAQWTEVIDDIAVWSKSQRREFTARSSGLARRKFSWGRVADETIAIYGSQFMAKAPAA